MAVMGILSFLFSGCSRNEIQPIPDQNVVEGAELICLAGSAEEAQQIADAYQIELVSFGDGVAVFHTDRDLNEVISYGKKNKLPELSPNQIVELD